MLECQSPIACVQVCEELSCEAIFPLAVNYVDRFLSVTGVSKNQLQLLGAVSLLVASKLRQCRAIHPEDLVYFSDYSYTTADVTVSLHHHHCHLDRLCKPLPWSRSGRCCC